jgi:large subunit ribosomal protein L6
VSVRQDDRELIVESAGASRQDRMNHGLVRSVLAGMVVGVTSGYRKELEIQGTGYRGKLDKGKLVLSLGYSHEVTYQAPSGVTVTMPDQTHIVVEGTDKQKVGQAAATIRSFRPPDVYHGKGVRYQGEVLRQKEGKTVG